jgi:hypothetical protein
MLGKWEGEKRWRERFNQTLRYFGVKTAIPSDDDNGTSDAGDSSSVKDFSSCEASLPEKPSNLNKSDGVNTALLFPKDTVAES